MKNFSTPSLAIAITFLFSSSLFSQTAPDLKTAASFVLFTGNGQFTSTSAATNVTGDVGNFVGAVSAFPPGNLTGTKHFGDPASNQASTDIAGAYADLAGRTCGIVHGVGFGVGEVLTPNTYCAGSASTLNGTLTFDALGNAAAVFIIKINGAFSAAAGSQVLLVNGATACNIYYQINGQTDLNSTDFKGTILGNGAINLNSGTTLNGRALSQAGDLIFQAINASVCNLSLLPIKLIKVDVAKTTGNNVDISWLTGSETNMARYEVEASINASAFYKVGTVLSKANNFSTQYTFQDKEAQKSGTRFYRVKLIEKDGAISYSEVKNVKFSEMKLGLVNIYPNPAINTLNITVNAEFQENITLTIANLKGQKLMQKTLKLIKGINNISEDIHSLEKAGYIVSIKNTITGKESRLALQKL